MPTKRKRVTANRRMVTKKTYTNTKRKNRIKRKNMKTKRKLGEGMKGGAVRKYKRRKIDDIAEVMSMILSGPKPTFGSLGMLLGKQAFKGVVDNAPGLMPYIQGGL